MSSAYFVISVSVVVDQGVQPTPTQVNVVGVGVGIGVGVEGELDEDEQQAGAEFLTADFAPKECLSFSVSFYALTKHLRRI